MQLIVETKGLDWFNMTKILFVVMFMCQLGCGGNIEPQFYIEEQEPGQNNEPYSGPYCGDYVCDEGEGENYWNCLDCVDPFTGGPKNGYCGDGICFNETMLSCWKDCRPRQYNPNSGFGFTPPKEESIFGPKAWPFPYGAEPNPLPPGPEPGPILYEDI